MKTVPRYVDQKLLGLYKAGKYELTITTNHSVSNYATHLKVNRQEPRLVWPRSIHKIATPRKWLISPLLEALNPICKRYSLENSQDKKTSNETCNIFKK